MNANPRIAILGTRGIPARYGGFETFAEELSVRLASRGAEVTVYCVAEGNQPNSFGRVKLEYVPSVNLGPLTTLIFDVRCLWRARRGFDVVYMLGYGAAQFTFLPRLFGCRVWLNPDGIEWKRAKWNWLARAYFRAMEFCSTRLPHRLIADAHAIRTHLEARHRRLVSCTVIPYGAPAIDLPPSTEALAEWRIEPRRYYLIVCRVEPENHIYETISGFVASESPYPLIVVGNVKAETEYARKVASLESDRVRMIGTVYDKQKLQALRYHCLAYFHGHSVGGTNPSLLEAMGCGNLVVAHDNSFNREVLGAAGWFFNAPEDIPALVQQIETLDPSAEAEARAYVRERVRSEYNWERVAAAYMQLLLADASEHI